MSQAAIKAYQDVVERTGIPDEVFGGLSLLAGLAPYGVAIGIDQGLSESKNIHREVFKHYHLLSGLAPYFSHNPDFKTAFERVKNIDGQIKDWTFDKKYEEMNGMRLIKRKGI